MIHFANITEDNWLEAARLKVWEHQDKFVAPSIGILARGYVYRHDRARVLAILRDDTLCGLMMVRDLTEEPACYDLQQFMIDWRYQGTGVGQKALTMLLDLLREEGRFLRVEVCVKKADAPALHIYEKAGFVDTHYEDPDCPDSVCLIREL